MISVHNPRGWTLCFFAAALFSNIAWAAPPSQHLLDVVRTDDPDFLNKISLNLDQDGDLTSLEFSLEKKPITLEQLREGFVLNRTTGIETVRLTAEEGFQLKSGGTLTLRYLTHYSINPFKSNQYAEFRMELVREGEKWFLRDEHHQDFNQLRLTKGSRGISEVAAVNVTAAEKLQGWVEGSVTPAHEDDTGVSDRALTSFQKAPSESSENSRPSGASSRAPTGVKSAL